MAIDRLKERLIHAEREKQRWLNVQTQHVLQDPIMNSVNVDAAELEQYNAAVTQHALAAVDIEAQLAQVTRHYDTVKNLIDQQQTMQTERLKAQRRSRGYSLSSVWEDDSILDVAPVEKNRKHAALARILNYKKIPVTDLISMDINYNRVQIKARSDAPVFKLRLKGVPMKDVSKTVVQGVVKFLEKFEKYYTRELTEDLFDDMAWRYMSLALEPSNISDLYDKTIVMPEYGDKTYYDVRRCISKIFKFDLMKSQILSRLFSIEAEPEEDASKFVDRLEILIKAAGVEDMGYHLVCKIVEALPDVGREKVLAEYKSLERIDRTQDLLLFIRANPSVMSGKRSDPCTWLVSIFKEDDDESKDESKAKDQGTTRTFHSAQPSHRGKGNARTRGGRGYKNTMHQSKPYHASEIKLEDQCKDAICQKRPKKHRDSDCFRHRDRAKWEVIKNKAFSATDRYKGANYAARRPQVAAIRRIQDDSLEDALGSDLAYAIKDMDIDLYDEGKNASENEPMKGHNSPASIAKAIRSSALITDAEGKLVDKSPNRSIKYAAPKTGRTVGFRGAQEGDNRIAVPIVIYGETYTALLDCGSEVSFIHSDLAKELGIKTAKLTKQKSQMSSQPTEST